MGICIAAVGKTIAIAATTFSLSWTHSVEKTQWQEDWAIVDDKLKLVKARVKGSGAGMDPGEGAHLIDGWWVWEAKLAPIAKLHLSASGATVSPWTLCYNNQIQCIKLGELSSEPIVLSACENSAHDRDMLKPN